MRAPSVNVGDRIRLELMGRDPDPVPPGTTGTVERVFDFRDGRWQIGVKWDNGRTLKLVWPEDRFTIIVTAIGAKNTGA